jgi:hypothetical protein
MLELSLLLLGVVLGRLMIGFIYRLDRAMSRHEPRWRREL